MSSYCREYENICENPNMTTILELIEAKLHEKLLINSKLTNESTRETDYYFIFLAK